MLDNSTFKKRLPKKSEISKRGQIGDTITWIAATLIIVVVLWIFVYISSVLVSSENFSNFIANVFTGSSSKINADWIGLKTSLAFKINDANKEKINGWIEND